MKCDSCGYVFTFDGTESCIQREGSFGQPLIFCNQKCKDKFYSQPEEEQAKQEKFQPKPIISSLTGMVRLASHFGKLAGVEPPKRFVRKLKE